MKPRQPGRSAVSRSLFQDVALERALGEHEAQLAFVITRAAEKDWRAALEMLRRRYPENWNTPLRQEPTGRCVESIQIDDARERLMEKVRQARTPPARQGIARAPTTAGPSVVGPVCYRQCHLCVTGRPVTGREPRSEVKLIENSRAAQPLPTWLRDCLGERAHRTSRSLQRLLFASRRAG